MTFPRLTPLLPARLGSRAVAMTALGAVLLMTTGCGSSAKLDKYFPDQRLEYKQQREAAENLEVPPDLTSGGFEDALDIPPASGTATYSDYTGARRDRAALASSGVLPEVEGVKLRRSGDKRWLEIDAPADAVWPKLVGFWRQQGILLLEQDPTVGLMKTDWLENRADIRKDFVTNMIRKVADGLYATSTRDQYRLRLDQGPGSGTSEVFLTHRGMEERLVRNTVGEGATTVWEPAGSDPEKEAAMLRRLMLYLGVSDREAQRMLAGTGGTASQTGARLAAGGSALIVPQELRRAWNQVGLALDRTGFAVEDRNRSEGVFFVRYDDPQRGQQKKGMLSRMAFWKRNDKISQVEQYQVRLSASGDETRVTVHDASGRPETSATGERILALLYDQMR